MEPLLFTPDNEPFFDPESFLALLLESAEADGSHLNSYMRQEDARNVQTAHTRRYRHLIAARPQAPPKRLR